MSHTLFLLVILISLESEPHLIGIKVQGRTPLNLNSLQKEISPPDTGYLLDREVISSLLQRVQSYFWDRGYPFTKVRVVRYDGPLDSLVMIVHVEPGRLVLLRGVKIYGLKNTNPKVIYVHLRELMGSVFNSTKIKKILSRVVKVYPILSVRKYKVSKGDTLSVWFNEQPSNFLEISAGYSKGVGVNGNLTFLSGNVFGTGRRIKIHWSRGSLQDQTFGFVLQDPTTFVKYLYYVFGSYTFRSGLFWQKEFGGKIGPIFSPVTLLIGFRQISSKDLQTLSSSVDYLSTVFIEYENQIGWQFKGDIQVGKRFRMWKFRYGYGFKNLFGLRMPLVINPYMKILGVFRRDGIKRFDYIEMGGVEGPLGYPPASLYFRDYIAIGTTVFIEERTYSPFLVGEWSQGNTQTGYISTKGIGIGFRQRTGIGELLVTYSLKLGNPVDEGLISMSLMTSF